MLTFDEEVGSYSAHGTVHSLTSKGGVHNPRSMANTQNAIPCQPVLDICSNHCRYISYVQKSLLEANGVSLIFRDSKTWPLRQSKSLSFDVMRAQHQNIRPVPRSLTSTHVS